MIYNPNTDHMRSDGLKPLADFLVRVLGANYVAGLLTTIVGDLKDKLPTEQDMLERTEHYAEGEQVYALIQMHRFSEFVLAQNAPKVIEVRHAPGCPCSACDIMQGTTKQDEKEWKEFAEELEKVANKS